MRSITIDGRIGKDGAKIFTTTTGKTGLRFSLANNIYTNGATKTEWFDVTTYDEYMVEKQAKLLPQGKYVIVQGTINTEVTVKNGKVYVNHYIKAANIDIPMLGNKKEEEEAKVSTYTGGTKSDQTVTTTPVTTPTPEPEVSTTPAPQPVAVAANNANWDNNDDDLPF